MEDTKILDLYFARDEQAIQETHRKYGAYCFSLARAILENEGDAEEAVDTIRNQIGEETFALVFQGMTEVEIVEQCYVEIVAREVLQQLEAEATSEILTIPLQGELKCISAGAGSVVISPVSLRIDITDLEFLHLGPDGTRWVDTGNIKSLILRYEDGTEYPVMDEYTLNYMFAVSQMPEENVQTEVIVSPEEDPNGEGFSYVENSHGYCLLTVMFNRVVDVDRVSAVVINQMELPVDKT